MPGKNSIDQYLEEIQEYDLLEPEEEIKLAVRTRKGDQEAMQQLVASNLRFAFTVAKQYRGQGLPMEDLINEANIGLIKAAHRFDPSRGFKFISYAVWWIRQSIRSALSNKSRKVRRPMNVIDAMQTISKEKQNFIEEHEREPSDEELAEITGYTETIVKDAKKSRRREKSLDAPLGGDDDRTLKEKIPYQNQEKPEDNLTVPSLHHDLEAAMEELTKRERDILKEYYGISNTTPQTLGKIGEKYGLTRERIRQIKEKALEKIQNTEISKELKTYLQEI